MTVPGMINVTSASVSQECCIIVDNVDYAPAVNCYIYQQCTSGARMYIVECNCYVNELLITQSRVYSSTFVTD